MVPMRSSKGRNDSMRMLYGKRIFLFLLIVTMLSSCASPRRVTPARGSTPQPTGTSIVASQAATAAPEFIDVSSGGFTLAVQPNLEFEAHEDSISISDGRGELVISLNGRPYVASSYTIQSFLGKYLAEMEARGGTFEQGEPYEIIIDGKNGLAIDFSGSFLDHPITGKAVAVSPGKDFIVFGLGMSLLSVHKNGWIESGSTIFETILESIHFNDEVK